MALLLVGAASCSDSESGNGLAAEPELISIIPVSGASGCTAIISGVNFAAEQSANKVFLDGQEAQVVSSSKDRIQIVTPEHADGKVDVKVSVNGKEVSGLDFTYVTLAEPEVKITALRPSFGFVGDNVTILGENFSDELADMSVTFDGVKANILTTSSSALSVTAPEHARGRVTVEVKNGAKTAVAEFTYVELMVEKSTPSEGGAGTIVTIYGEGFSEELANNVVMVGDQVLKVTEATATTLKVEMPALGTGTYTFTVKVGERVCTGGSDHLPWLLCGMWKLLPVVLSVEQRMESVRLQIWKRYSILQWDLTAKCGLLRAEEQEGMPSGLWTLRLGRSRRLSALTMRLLRILILGALHSIPRVITMLQAKAVPRCSRLPLEPMKSVCWRFLHIN